MPLLRSIVVCLITAIAFGTFFVFCPRSNASFEMPSSQDLECLGSTQPLNNYHGLRQMGLPIVNWVSAKASPSPCLAGYESINVNSRKVEDFAIGGAIGLVVSVGALLHKTPKHKKADS